jgi:photosystem II stability/assembly factor-like uncharacterized protein
MKKMILLALFLLNKSFSLAQWQKTNGPYNAYIKCFATSGTDIYAMSYNTIFLSTNGGLSWVKVSDSIGSWPYVYQNCLMAAGGNMFLGTNNGVFLSANNGSTWTSTNNGLPPNTRVFSLFTMGTNVYIGTDQGVFVSGNNGNNWISSNSGLPPNTAIFSFLKNGSNIYIGSTNGVFVSTDGGNSWTSSSTGMQTAGNAVFSFSTSGSNIFAGTFMGVYMSTNAGGTWTAINNGLNNNPIWSLAANATTIYAGTSNGLFFSNNNGNSWSLLNDTILSNQSSNFQTDISTEVILINGSDILTGGNAGIHFSANNGITWNNVDGLPYGNVYALATNGDIIYASSKDGIYSTTDDGISWKRRINDGRTLKAKDSCVFAGFVGGNIYVSSNYGHTWVLSTGFFDNSSDVLAVAGTTVFAQYDLAGSPIGYKSTDNGLSFIQDNPPYSIFANRDDTSLFALWNNTVLYYTAGLWSPVSTSIPDSGYALAVNTTAFFVGTNGGVLISAHNGSSWAKVNFGLSSAKVTCMAVKGGALFAGTSNNELYSSFDNGNTWSSITDNFMDTIVVKGLYDAVEVTPLVINHSYLFVGGRKGIWKRPLSEINGIKNESINSGVTIYPNPSTGNFTIRISKKLHKASVSIVDILGREIEILHINPERSTISADISCYPKGVYYIDIHSANDQYRSKVIIN